jgi:hypothetical protein
MSHSISGRAEAEQPIFGNTEDTILDLAGRNISRS